MHRFRATIETGSAKSKSACYVTISAALIRQLGNGWHVNAVIGGTSFAGTLQARADGVMRLLITREVRAALGLERGHCVDVDITAKEPPRGVEIPPAFTAALAARPDIAQTFAALAPSHRRQYAAWIAEAKRPQTQAARIERALSMIRAKQRAT